MKKIHIFGLVFISMLMVITVKADAVAEETCKPTLDEAKYLPDVRQATFDFINVLQCQSPNDEDAASAYTKLLSALDGWFDRFGGFKGSISPLNRAQTILRLEGERVVTIGVSITDTLMVEDRSFAPADEVKCETVANAACGAVLDEFVGFFGEANRVYTLPEIEQTQDRHKGLREEWDPFLTQMRSQTPIELAVNGWWFRRNETDEFAPPPEMQWIVLHPIVLLEYGSGAEDGDEMNEAIGLELFGANWWKKREWYMPSGGSLLALYSDRSEVQDWGIGVAVHFNNVYTVGVADHGGDTSVFLSVDLLKAFHDKKNVFDSYTNRD